MYVKLGSGMGWVGVARGASKRGLSLLAYLKV
jgi:hypothetical protein